MAPKPKTEPKTEPRGKTSDEADGPVGIPEHEPGDVPVLPPPAPAGSGLPGDPLHDGISN